MGELSEPLGTPLGTTLGKGLRSPSWGTPQAGMQEYLGTGWIMENNEFQENFSFNLGNSEVIFKTENNKI